MVVKIAIQLIWSDDSAILQLLSVSKYGHNHFLVGTVGSATKTLRNGGIAAHAPFSQQPRISGSQVGPWTDSEKTLIWQSRSSFFGTWRLKS